MPLNYENALRLEGEIIKYQNKDGDWKMGRVAKVRKDGLEMEELNPEGTSDGYGFPFWGPGPFFGPPAFVPFVAFGFAAPFFFW